MNSHKKLEKITLYPKNMKINSNGIKYFLWPVKNKEVKEFRNILIKEVSNFLKDKKNIGSIILNIPYIMKDIINLFIAKKFAYYLSSSYKNKKTGSNFVDQIRFNKKISLPIEIRIILNGLRKRNYLKTKIKQIQNFVENKNFNYIKKEKIKENHIITFSNNLLIKKKSQELSNKVRIKTSHFQDWFPSGKIILKKKKKRKEIILLYKIVLNLMKKYKLKFNINEKDYLFNLFYNWDRITDFFLEKLDENKIFLPKTLWVGSSGIFYNRVFAYAVKKNGGNVYGFDHGSSSGIIKSSTKNLLEFPHVDFYYTFSSGMAKALQKNFKKNIFNEKFNKKNILNIKINKINSIIKKKRKKDINNILYVPRIYAGDRFVLGYDHYHSDIVYADWQIKLINTLNLLDLKINIRPHPESHSIFPLELSKKLNVEYCSKNSFKEEIIKSDILFFDCVQTSAFFDAISTNIPIVFLNINELEINKHALDLIKKRCGYVSCSFDKNNRLKINKLRIKEEINKSIMISKNIKFYNHYFN